MGRYKQMQKEAAADIANIDRFIDSDELEAALGEEGAITTAIADAIAAAIDTGGDIETWADARYAAKSNG